MKEEEGGRGYMSPLVKQDLANLEKEGECRRVAWNALKHIVEKLEPGCVPKFLAQVSESKDAGGSRSYAISLYEDVARVHGKLIIPHIGRLMATVTKALSANGTPQLHQACAKVVSALVRYSIDLETSPAEAEEILRETSEPLVEVLAGKLEHVAAGAATCLQAVVESEKWKHATMELVSEVCHQTTTALGDKSTRTVAHVQLAIALATINPSILSVYGACLLHVGEEVLNGRANSWQHRKYAAKMVQAVVAIVDKDTLALELSSIMQVLESCRHDRMPNVRTAVCEALQTAKRLATEDNIRLTDEGDDLVPSSKFSESFKMTPRRRSCSSIKFSPKSQESHAFSHSPPSMASDSEISSRHSSLTPAGMGSTGRTRRSPLFPSRTDISIEAAPSLPSSTVDKINALSRHLDAKENLPSQIQDVNGIVAHQDSGLSGIHMRKYVRPRAAMSGSYIPLPPSLLETSSGAKPPAGFQVNQKEVSDEKNITPSLVTEAHRRGRVVSLLSPLEAQITRSFGEAEGDLMAEDEDILSGGSADLTGRFSGRNGNSIQGGSRQAIASLNLRQDSESPESMVHSECIQSAESNRSVGSNYSDANELCERRTQSAVSSFNGSGMGLVENGRLSANDLLNVGAPGNSQVGDIKAGFSHAEYVRLGSLSPNIEDSFSALKPRVLLTAADFLPFATPRRLVRSLQSELSSPDIKSNVVDQEVLGRVDEHGLAELTEFNGDADMDVESSSDAGWSVRDNPVASDESFQSEASFEESQETLLIPQKVPSVDGKSSRMAVTHFVDSGLDQARTPISGKGDDIGTYRLTPKSFGSPAESPAAELACSSCTNSQRKRSLLKAQEWDLGMDIDKEFDEKKTGARRSMLFGQDPREAGLCFSHPSEASVTGSVYKDGREDQEASAVSSGSVSEGWWSHRLGQSSLVCCAKNSCLRMSYFAEIVLGGSLCAVIALPVAMVMARALGTQSDCFLVPT